MSNTVNVNREELVELGDANEYRREMFGGRLNVDLHAKEKMENVSDGRLLKPSRHGGKQKIQWTKAKVMRRFNSS
jgi:hypothetical protein